MLVFFIFFNLFHFININYSKNIKWQIIDKAKNFNFNNFIQIKLLTLTNKEFITLF